MTMTMTTIQRLLFLLSALVAVARAAEECELGEDGTCLEKKDCVDTHEKCGDWMETGECDANPVYMLSNCRKSCNTCDVLDPAEMRALVRRRSELHEVGGDETLLETPYGLTQDVSASVKEQVSEVINNFTLYMDNLIFAKEEYAAVKKTCKNRHRQCAYWKTLGECENNPEYMQKQCAPACETCHLLDFRHRCPVDETDPEALKPGDLNKMFNNIMMNDHYKQYEPKALSMPNPTEEEKTEGVLDGPWVVILDKLLTAEECDRLIQLGADEGYEVSADVGKKKFDGTYDKSVNKGRTSHNAWCGDDCMGDDATKSVNAKLENVTGVPEANHEFLQLLRYEVGQFYQTHHDYIPYHTERYQGVRTLTVFLYLNDVEEGGGTEFPTLGITVMPKKGKAVIWPSVFDDDPNSKDGRTEHGALPVEKGIKYGANAWIHQRDFKETLARGCI